MKKPILYQDSSQETVQKRFPNIIGVIKNWGVTLFIAVLVALSFRSAVAELNVVPTGSMEPTILIGDRIFVNKLAYDLKIPFTLVRMMEWTHPRRGDIVVFFSPADGKRLVKRVVGLPGDRVAMRNNRLWINGAPLAYKPLKSMLFEKSDAKEDYLFFSEKLADRNHPVKLNRHRPSIHSFPPVTVPARSYFVLGDNRDNSGDSRVFGFIPRRRILGKATRIAYSLNPENSHFPRWQRFFQRL
jgi:signal peptidase I